MKRVLITGENSYIGVTFEKYVTKHYGDQLKISTIDMISGEWKKADFSVFDIVYHVAGIAHADVGNVSDEVKAKYYENIPLARFGEANDIAEAVAFLASDKSSYITGQVINVDGGLVM